MQKAVPFANVLPFVEWIVSSAPNQRLHDTTQKLRRFPIAIIAPALCAHPALAARTGTGGGGPAAILFSRSRTQSVTQASAMARK